LLRYEQTDIAGIVAHRIRYTLEKNLVTMFNCYSAAAEFSTGALHACRIDILALSEAPGAVIFAQAL
jgi:hypothetical protein